MREIAQAEFSRDLGYRSRNKPSLPFGASIPAKTVAPQQKKLDSTQLRRFGMLQFAAVFRDHRRRSVVGYRGHHMQHWFLAQTRPNADQMAKRNLQRQGFATFQPMEMRSIVRRGRLLKQLRPFFSGYLFVSHPSDAPPWSLVNSTYGISRLVKFGDQLIPVPVSVMADLFTACQENAIISREQGPDVGDRIEVLHGPLASFVGKLERLSPDERAVILLDIIGKQTRVVVTQAYLRSASCHTQHTG